MLAGTPLKLLPALPVSPGKVIGPDIEQYNDAVGLSDGLLQPVDIDDLIRRAAAIEHAHPRPPRLKRAASLIRLSKPA